MLSVPHLVIIFLVALIVFGPEKLPELARTFGRAMSEFKRATGDLRAGFEEHMRELEREASIREAQRASTPPSNTSAAPDVTAASEPEHEAEQAPHELDAASPEADASPDSVEVAAHEHGPEPAELPAPVPEAVPKKAYHGDV
ncbi:MAG TPA: twin-arginine translocase TatA/TatE family subunit [Candidatus Acidoferrales bacterium]|nr:twin-arginine translocase TatA/TatE family subunit [Candidatus Acidoferrales bacterium]